MNKDIFESILALMPGHVYWKDRECTLLGCNTTLAQTLGLASPSEIVGKTDYDLASKEEAEAIRAFDFSVMEKREEQIKEETYILPNGEKAIYLSKKSPLFDADSNVVGIVGISIDITDKKNAEKFELEKNLAEEKAHFSKVAAGSIATICGHLLPRLMPA